MDTFLPIIKETPLFEGIADSDIKEVLQGLAVRCKTYEKGNFIFYAGDDVRRVGIVLSGLLHIIQEDYWGNRNILVPIGAGNMFGEAFACIPGICSTVSVAVMERAEILFIDVSHLLQAESILTKSREKLSMNLLGIMARKNMELTEKIRYISQRSTRQKLMFYLSDEAHHHGSPEFTISFNRQQLADYLSVDRSAMSAELSRMKKEGLLDYQKEHFLLKSIT